jgi:hypothetical protein
MRYCILLPLFCNLLFHQNLRHPRRSSKALYGIPSKISTRAVHNRRVMKRKGSHLDLRCGMIGRRGDPWSWKLFWGMWYMKRREWAFRSQELRVCMLYYVWRRRDGTSRIRRVYNLSCNTKSFLAMIAILSQVKELVDIIE